jgi:hypothetical protein
MKTTALSGAPTRAIAAALALTAVINSEAPVSGTANNGRAQYCAPIEEAADANAHRFYCRDGRGFEQHGATPAAASSS